MDNSSKKIPGRLSRSVYVGGIRRLQSMAYAIVSQKILFRYINNLATDPMVAPNRTLLATKRRLPRDS